MIIARRKQFFRGTLANFCKSKKCIIFYVHYRPGLKKSKFDMTLIRHSPFKIKTMIVDSTLKEKLALIRHHGYENFLYFGMIEKHK